MKFSLLRQATEYLREHKTTTRALSILLCLAFVIVDTVGMLAFTGLAETQQVKVLTCPLTPHQHTDQCRDKEGSYVCGYADYVVHIHNDDCYNEDGALVCSLPQIPRHTHTDGCYTVTRVLTCGKEEGEGHIHGDACYTETRELTCGQEEHTHSDACYNAASQTLTCQKQEHTHTDHCYQLTETLVCAIPEGEGAHTHTGDCYEVTKELTCGKLELHEHTVENGCFDEQGNLVCKEIELLEHVHGEDCFTVVEKEIGEENGESGNDDDLFFFRVGGEASPAPSAAPEYVCGLTEHIHNDSCINEAGEIGCGLTEHIHDENCTAAPEASAEPMFFCGFEEHIHSDECYNESGEPVCGLEEHQHTEECLVKNYTQTVEADGIRVTAKYTSEAMIPEEAIFKVKRIMPEGEAAGYYEQRAEKASEIFADKAAQSEDEYFKALALLNVGFYLEDGTEVNPAAPVTVTIRFLDETGAVGDAITVIHFADTGTEILDGSEVNEEQESTFVTESFSDMIVGKILNARKIDFQWDKPSGKVEYKEFEHDKYIDYLGDGGNNPDTDLDEKAIYTDDLYRIYLDMEDKSEPLDVLFVIDRSNSMTGSLNGTSRWRAVYNMLEGKKSDGSDGLLYQFLAQNKVPGAKGTNHAAVVWFAGINSGRMKNENYLGKGVKEAIGADASTEGGVTRKWMSTYTRAGTGNYNKKNTCTNYVAGFVQADKMLNDPTIKDDGNRKVVFFMSDGIPVYFYYANGKNGDGTGGDKTRDVFDFDHPDKAYRYGGGTEIYDFFDMYIGMGGVNSTLIKDYMSNVMGVTIKSTRATAKDVTNITYSPYISETLRIFYGSDGKDSFMARHPDISFYTVSVANSGTVSAPSYLWGSDVPKHDREYILKKMAEAYGGQMYSANDLDGLKYFLKQVMFPAGVMITDELSANVEYYSADPDVKVEAIAQKKGGKNVVLYENGRITENSLNGVKAANILESVKYDTAGRRITAKFKDNYNLNEGYKFTLSFNVKLSDAAYDAYARNLNTNKKAEDGTSGYTDVGDAETDYPGNDTSSGHDGLFSNNRAYVKYTIGREESEPLPYDDPVVQAWGTQLRLHKVDDTGVNVKDAAFRLDYTGLEKKSELAPTVGAYTEAADNEGKKLDGFYFTDSNGEIIYGVLPAGKYTLKEYIKEGFKGAGTTVEVAAFEVEDGRITDVKITGNKDLGISGTWIADPDGHIGVKKGGKNNVPGAIYGGNGEMKIVNTSDKQEVKIVKQDSEGGELGGAAFTLYRLLQKPESGTWTGGLIYGTYVSGDTDNDGKADENGGGLVFKGELPYGWYRLEETNAPDNYSRLKDAVYFTVEDGVVTLDNNAGGSTTLNAADGKISITITDQINEIAVQLIKQDTDGRNIAGAKFALYGPFDSGADYRTYDLAEYTLLWTGVSDTDGIVAGEGENGGFPALTAGRSYVLRETEAPVGYNMTPGDVLITVGRNGAVSTNLKDTKTGDDVNSGRGTVSVNGGEDDSIIQITVKDTNGYQLPESGGEGVTAVYVLGALLALAGAALLLRKRRENKA